MICFISNYSWLDGLSFPGMRERYLKVFDTVRIDNLHGDRIISEYAPDGRTSETVFSVRGYSPGIKIGTSIALLSRSESAGDDSAGRKVLYRDFDQAKAVDRRQAMLDSLGNSGINTSYEKLDPDVRLGLPLRPMQVSDDWFDWPSLPELFPTSFSGVATSRDSFLVDIDLDRLKARVGDYFNQGLDHGEIARRYPVIMESVTHYDAQQTRKTLLERGGPDENGFVKFFYRPFDIRWLYWEAETNLLDRGRPEYKPHVSEENIWISSAKFVRKSPEEPQSCFMKHLSCKDRIGHMFPAWLLGGGAAGKEDKSRRPNLKETTKNYLGRLGLDVEDLFFHTLATIHNPAYRKNNVDGLRMGWPRIPLPGWNDGNSEGAAQDIAASAARGRRLANLLDSETSVADVTAGENLREYLAVIAVRATKKGGSMSGDDFCLIDSWGHFGARNAVSSGRGRIEKRKLTSEEKKAMGDTLPVLGDTTFDIYLNDNAFWRNVPAAVWNYNLGGYQVLKKWLSYRALKVLGRPMKIEEVEHFTDTARRIAAILLLTHNLD